MIGRRKRVPPAAPAAPKPPPPPPPSEETRRARAAARAAAVQLDQVRAQRVGVDRSAWEMDELNNHNGFYSLVRQALGA